MRTEEPRPVRLAEYTPPDYFVDEVIGRRVFGQPDRLRLIGAHGASL